MEGIGALQLSNIRDTSYCQSWVLKSGLRNYGSSQSFFKSRAHSPRFKNFVERKNVENNSRLNNVNSL